MEKTIYHSTNENCLKQILESKKVKVNKQEFGSKKRPGSLGYGFYGFSDESLCKQYGTEKIGTNCKYLSCNISVCDKRILNLYDENQLKKYNTYKNFIKNKPVYAYSLKEYKNTNTQSSLEGALIELYIKSLEKFGNIDCVIGMTSTQIDVSKKSFLANGIEYCIRNNDIIENMKEVVL